VLSCELHSILLHFFTLLTLKCFYSDSYWYLSYFTLFLNNTFNSSYCWSLVSFIFHSVRHRYISYFFILFITDISHTFSYCSSLIYIYLILLYIVRHWYISYFFILFVTDISRTSSYCSSLIYLILLSIICQWYLSYSYFSLSEVFSLIRHLWSLTFIQLTWKCRALVVCLLKYLCYCSFWNNQLISLFDLMIICS